MVNAAGVVLNQNVPGPWRNSDPLPVGTRVVRTPSNTRTITTPVAATVVWVDPAARDAEIDRLRRAVQSR